MRIKKSDLLILLYTIDSLLGKGEGKMTVKEAAQFISKRNLEYIEFDTTEAEKFVEVKIGDKDNHTIKSSH